VLRWGVLRLGEEIELAFWVVVAIERGRFSSQSAARDAKRGNTSMIAVPMAAPHEMEAGFLFGWGVCISALGAGTAERGCFSITSSCSMSRMAL